MNIQLFLDNEEVELTNKIQFPLNACYENLSSPTDIIVDYSKSIDLPVTKRNSQIFGHIYRLDKLIIDNKSEDIGVHFDPTKKIPFKLLYNNDMILEGYAKFNSASYSAKNKYYRINLFSTLGDVFQKLKSVVINAKQLSDKQLEEEDRGQKYILNDRLSGAPLTKEYVADSFAHINNNCTQNNPTDLDILGFAPSYRGLYKNFESGKIQNTSGSIVNISDLVEQKWTKYYTDKGLSEDEAKTKASNLKASELTGNGFADYQMDEYRFYEMKPYLYVNQLFYSYMNKCKELTGYDITLDKLWFNLKNVYWKNAIYSLDFLENKNRDKGGNDHNIIFNRASTNNITYTSGVTTRNIRAAGDGDFNNDYNNDFLVSNTPTGAVTAISTISTSDGGTIKQVNGKINIAPFDISSQGTYLNLYEGARWLDDHTVVDIDMIIEGVGFNKKIHFWYTQTGKESYPDKNPNEFIQADGLGTTIFHIPEINIDTNKDIVNPKITFNVKYYNDTELNKTRGIYRANIWNEHIGHRPVLFNPGYTTNTTFTLTINNIYTIGGLRYSNIKLNNFYFSDKSLFETVILNYTKMFGLLWILDEKNHSINITTKYNYFKDSLNQITSWDDKLDRNKDYIVEPVSFDNSYVLFNYEKLEGNKYSSYKDKYGLAYGEKKIDTRYNSTGKEKKLFKDIYPSLSESKSYLKFDSVLNWDIDAGELKYTQDKVVMPAAEDKNEKSSISVTNFYLRGDNQNLSKPIWITQDSNYQVSQNEFCWILPSTIESQNVGVKCTSIPTISTVYKNQGFQFTCPQEDYTYNSSIAVANGNFIYDLIWRDYLDERYNIQNKKVTAYFHLSPEDYTNFRFNKLITLDNQLFMVNKIMDYDIASNETTKCELVQVTNIDAYINEKIYNVEDIIAKPNSITMRGDGDFAVEYESDVPVTITKPRYEGQFGSVTVKNKTVISPTTTRITYNFSGFNNHPGEYSGEILTSNGTMIIRIPFKVII